MTVDGAQPIATLLGNLLTVTAPLPPPVEVLAEYVPSPE
jgi:hypothetical protein